MTCPKGGNSERCSYDPRLAAGLPIRFCPSLLNVECFSAATRFPFKRNAAQDLLPFRNFLSHKLELDFCCSRT